MIVKFFTENGLVDKNNIKSLIKIFEWNLDPVESIYNDLKTISFEDVLKSEKFLCLMNQKWSYVSFQNDILLYLFSIYKK